MRRLFMFTLLGFSQIIYASEEFKVSQEPDTHVGQATIRVCNDSWQTVNAFVYYDDSIFRSWGHYLRPGTCEEYHPKDGWFNNVKGIYEVEFAHLEAVSDVCLDNDGMGNSTTYPCTRVVYHFLASHSIDIEDGDFYLVSYNFNKATVTKYS